MDSNKSVIKETTVRTLLKTFLVLFATGKRQKPYAWRLNSIFLLAPAFWYISFLVRRARACMFGLLQTLPHPRYIDEFPFFGSKIQYAGSANAPIHSFYQWNILRLFPRKECKFIYFYSFI